MLHQVEFLIEGYLLPITIGELFVSESLFIEKVSPKHLDYEQKDYAIAYVAVNSPKEANYFRLAIDYLDFFLLIHSLMSGQSFISRIGVGTALEDLNSLGTKRITFQGYEKIYMTGEPEGDFHKPILEIKKRFLELLPARKKIMESHLGMALIYYYFAVYASQKRLEEAPINLMIAAEALLIVKNESIRSSLSRRLSTLIAKNEEEKKVIAEKVKKLYDLRSAIVHGRGKKPQFQAVKTLFNYIRTAIDAVLDLRVFSKSDLVEKLDKMNDIDN